MFSLTYRCPAVPNPRVLGHGTKLKSERPDALFRRIYGSLAEQLVILTNSPDGARRSVLATEARGTALLPA